MPAEIRTYSKFVPSAFDHHYEVPERENWLLVPVNRNRDSDCLDESNFATALKMMGGESETVEIHRFGHWACGWFEILLSHPDRLADVQKIADEMDDYPCLDEEDWGNREYERASAYWESASIRERLEILRDYGPRNPNIFAARRDELPCDIDISALAR